MENNYEVTLRQIVKQVKFMENVKKNLKRVSINFRKVVQRFEELIVLGRSCADKIIITFFS